MLNTHSLERERDFTWMVLTSEVLPAAGTSRKREHRPTSRNLVTSRAPSKTTAHSTRPSLHDEPSTPITANRSPNPPRTPCIHISTPSKTRKVHAPTLPTSPRTPSLTPDGRLRRRNRRPRRVPRTRLHTQSPRQLHRRKVSGQHVFARTTARADTIEPGGGEGEAKAHREGVGGD
jgi:hypothetical protein